MPAPLQLGVHRAQLLPHPLLHRAPFQEEFAGLRLRAHMRETEEVEGTFGRVRSLTAQPVPTAWRPATNARDERPQWVRVFAPRALLRPALDAS